MSNLPVARFEGIAKSFHAGWLGRGTLPALTDVSFQIDPGEVFALLGPNRAGKTTLVKILLSLCRPTSGRVTRFGQPSTNLRTLERVGYMHESQAFPRYLSASGLLEFYGALAFIPEPEIRRRVPKLLEFVGLADRCQEPIARFSKGMIQRLGLAQALINDPDLLVLDEPTEGLDLVARRLVFDLVAERRRQGRTILLVSHMLTEVEQLCDRAAVLVGGSLRHLGSISSLTRNPATGEVRCLEEALQELFARPAA